jgi:predicted MPP superfamily phosphohydrolase
MFLAATLFFISIVSYGFLNAWMWDRARHAYPLLDRRTPSVLGLAGVLFFTAAPIATRIIEAHGLHGAATVFALLGDPWMAIAFWFCIAALVLDLWDHILRVLSRRVARAARFTIGARGQFLAAASVAACLAVWGLVEANIVHARDVRIATPKLAAGSRPLTIAHISDVHVGIGSRRTVTEQAARLVRARRPDVIVVTGDVFDSGDPASLDISPLAAMQAPLGKFAVLGNHEYYTGASECVAALRAAGFRMLIDETVVLPVAGGATLVLAGNDDPAGRQMTRMGRPRRGPEMAAIGAPNPKVGVAESTGKRSSGSDRTNGSSFVLRLRHRPDVGTPEEGPFDLQLSGHTHEGQIWPFRYLINLAHRHTAGLHDVGGGRALLVSRGVGTWGPPMRFLSPPEVLFVSLEPVLRQ